MEEITKEHFESFGSCRCCLQQGCFKSLWSEYSWMAVCEIYGIMLSDCFSLSYEPNVEGKDLICEICILRLRDAFNFKKQVINSQHQLSKSTFFMKEASSSETEADDYQEVQYLDNEIIIPNTLDGIETMEDGRCLNDDDEYIKIIVADDSEANPSEVKHSTRRKSNYKQYSEASLLKCLADVRSGALRVSRAAIHYNVPRKTITEKIRSNYPGKTGTKSVETNINGNSDTKFTKEVEAFLTLTNAIPFKTMNNKFHCLYCYNEFIYFDELKAHTETVHAAERTEALGKIMKPNYLHETLKIDVENLQCTECSIDLNWTEVFKHLKDVHEIVFQIAEKKLIPFTLKRNLNKCVLCNENALNFAKLDAHMNKHLKNYICDECAETFLSYNRFIKHVQLHKQGQYPCQVCGKLFLKEKYMKKHFEGVHRREKKIQCRFCAEKFTSYYARHSHNLEKHPEKVQIINCEYCSKTFDWNIYYMAHVRKDHLNERKHVCEECGLKFFMVCELKKHVLTHTGNKEFECGVCKKRFSTKYGLNIHLKVHWDSDLGDIPLHVPRKRRKERMHAVVRQKLEKPWKNE